MSAEEELASLRTRRALPTAQPALLSLHFGDERTALVKLLGADGRERYLSMLRIDGLDAMAHDGWQIVREVVGGPPAAASTAARSHTEDAHAAVRSALDSYLCVEHGGGEADCEVAQSLFAQRAALLSVGSAPPEEPVSAWSAPAGTFLEIPLEVYLDGVRDQTPHETASAAHDVVASVDVLPCGTAAAAIVHVGNGARTRLFVDHLLLGRDAEAASDGAWRILSKTFAPLAWPSA